MNLVDHRLYVLLDPVAAPRNTLPELARKAVAGGATLLQYRDKEAEGGLMVETARAILEALGTAHPPLLINDRVDVARIVNAQGVHLGQGDITPHDARLILGPNAIIGRTIKNKIHAEKLRAEPVDYATAGGVFGTVHKDNPDRPIGSMVLKNPELFYATHCQNAVGRCGINHDNLGESSHRGGALRLRRCFESRKFRTGNKELRQRSTRFNRKR